MSSSSPPSLDAPAAQAIDIQEALTILSARTEDPNHTHGHEGCCHGTPAPEDAKGMGQTIDMTAPTPTTPATEEFPNEEEQKKLQEERAKRRQEIHDEMERMTVRELLQAVMKAQQDRVAAYRDYER